MACGGRRCEAGDDGHSVAGLLALPADEIREMHKLVFRGEGVQASFISTLVDELSCARGRVCVFCLVF